MVEILDDDAPAPRLCHLIKWPDFDGYGFNLHAERANPGQFIGKIDDESPAQLAGLREGDRIVEVNGVNISNENHRQVVERIKAEPHETRLLVVDAAADAWYRERQLVVKASQLNVVYIRTPVPRPQPDSPRAKFHAPGQSVSPGSTGFGSSLEPSDSLDEHDSIEPKAPSPPPPPQQQLQQASGRREQLSPDSGEGEECVLTVEAEINRQSAAAGAGEPEVAPPPPKELEADSLVDSSETEKVEQARQAHNGSADSGKSSSPETALTTSSSSSSSSASSSSSSSSSAGDSLADSLEDHQTTTTTTTAATPAAAIATTNGLSSQPQQQQRKAADEDEKEQKADEDDEIKQTIKNYQTGTAATKSHAATATSGEPADAAEDTTAESSDAQPSSPAAGQPQQVPADDGETVAASSTPSPPPQPLKSALTNSNSGAGRPVAAAQLTAKSQTNNGSGNNNNNNNNYSGLNLNMTASEMRELIASRKKFDPKKAQMNIRQKYEIIQQM